MASDSYSSFFIKLPMSLFKTHPPLLHPYAIIRSDQKRSCPAAFSRFGQLEVDRSRGHPHAFQSAISFLRVSGIRVLAAYSGSLCGLHDGGRNEPGPIDTSQPGNMFWGQVQNESELCKIRKLYGCQPYLFQRFDYFSEVKFILLSALKGNDDDLILTQRGDSCFLEGLNESRATSRYPVRKLLSVTIFIYLEKVGEVTVLYQKVFINGSDLPYQQYFKFLMKKQEQYSGCCKILKWKNKLFAKKINLLSTLWKDLTRRHPQQFVKLKLLKLGGSNHKTILWSGEAGFCLDCQLSFNISFVHSYFFHMHRTTVALLQSHKQSVQQCSQICKSTPRLNLKSVSRRLDKKRSTLKLNASGKYSLSEMRYNGRSNVNTVFSSRLFYKARRLKASAGETFLPQPSLAGPNNETKQKDAFQAYYRLLNRGKTSSSVSRSKRKRLSMSLHQNTRTSDPLPEAQQGESLASSLTKIIINQCQIDGLSRPSDDCSEWDHILQEAWPASPKRKVRKEEAMAENPYELLQIRRKRGGRKENRRPVVSAVGGAVPRV